jgi:NADP-dependent 3-hydroxy acid dehydrogenase YdfG
MSSETIVGVYKDVYPSIGPSIYKPEEFKDKVVIVTGAGSGIGRETALAFSQVGAKVAFTDWNEENARKAAAEAKQFGNPTIVVGGDVTKLADTERLYKAVTTELGEVDVIVCAAGYGMFDKFSVSREKDWWGLIETNLKGPTDLTRLVLPSMIKRNTGSLIYISSRVILPMPSKSNSRRELWIIRSRQLTAFPRRD